MTRVKGGMNTRRKHKKTLMLAKGYRGGRSKLFKQAKNAVMKAGIHAYRNRKEKKREFRSLWITRINAALKELNLIKYNRFIAKLEEKRVALDRKALSELAIRSPESFKRVVEFVVT
ncbi:50S ribosomal protein L20 [Candidatus Peregrinibacteria bacterium RIFOXYC2_FULL_33_13]|nr:MAG: 50S ribosomal protein L20 [Candidatus Peregrinibacteria bacterium GW2011_GWA2_33_10]KKP40114.1 MAG: 50S ribosomal protein L20P, large subunit ribosomal protein L20 [Candidatus Peregrinibacteria bacterium GW2011_GWC2_33_13]OGJ50900.1 MAG: 50S ribosomal protein L20 [Candidatus Peregrinibacteria bacterium RIFOXYA2_FULL_33_7]OGJ52053.1 MAG: 50S ribosomal protein L20 [Candidatus Peregrinibacteria bacterium RIFOXYC2_FULL_33_13]